MKRFIIIITSIIGVFTVLASWIILNMRNVYEYLGENFATAATLAAIVYMISLVFGGLLLTFYFFVRAIHGLTIKITVDKPEK